MVSTNRERRPIDAGDYESARKAEGDGCWRILHFAVAKRVVPIDSFRGGAAYRWVCGKLIENRCRQSVTPTLHRCRTSMTVARVVRRHSRRDESAIVEA